MKKKLLLIIGLIALITSIAFIDSYATRIRQFTSVPSPCAENSVGYSITSHNLYICTDTGYKPLLILGIANTWSTTQTFAHITSTSGIIGGSTHGADINFFNLGVTIPAGDSFGITASGTNQAVKDTRLFRSTAGIWGVGTSNDSTIDGQIAAKSVNLQCSTITNLPTGVTGKNTCVTDGDAGLVWGATVINSGAGATKYLVWYNGSNWTVTGK